jgi:hypothetical protein
MKTMFKLRNIFALLLVITLLSCSDDEDSNEQDNDYTTSYAQFNIEGSITNGSYDFRDTSNDDEFNTLGYFYTTADDPDLSEDQIQLYIGKSFTDSNFLLVAPPEIGSHNINYQDGNDFEVGIVLDALEDNFYAKAVTINIIELEINNNTVKHCKGTFTGTFYKNNLVESNVHQISGDFEINN